MADPSARLTQVRVVPTALLAGAPGSERRSSMSKTCGDMARFNRLRKQKIARRQNVRELRAAIEAAKIAKTVKPAA